MQDPVIHVRKIMVGSHFAYDDGFLTIHLPHAVTITVGIERRNASTDQASSQRLLLNAVIPYIQLPRRRSFFGFRTRLSCCIRNRPLPESGRRCARELRTRSRATLPRLLTNDIACWARECAAFGTEQWTYQLNTRTCNEQHILREREIMASTDGRDGMCERRCRRCGMLSYHAGTRQPDLTWRGLFEARSCHFHGTTNGLSMIAAGGRCRTRWCRRRWEARKEQPCITT